MDLDAYVAEHAAEWQRLRSLTRRRRLSADEVDELVVLYQRAATHLSVIRSRSPDPGLIADLSRLVLGARAAITGASGWSPRALLRFFVETFPLAVYRIRFWWAGVAVGFTAVALAVMGYGAANPDVLTMFVSQDQMQLIAESEFVSYYSEYQPQNFALQVWTHNALLAAQCLASGILVLPVCYLLWENALSLGLVGGVMAYYGRADVFFAYVTPHGLLELTAVHVAAGAGLRIGWSWMAPGPDRTRSRAIAETAREAMVVALGLVVVLLVSGLIEGFVTPAGLPTAVRIGIGAAAWLGFCWYVAAFGRSAALRGATADLEEHDRGTALPTGS